MKAKPENKAEVRQLLSSVAKRRDEQSRISEEARSNKQWDVWRERRGMSIAYQDVAQDLRKILQANAKAESPSQCSSDLFAALDQYFEWLQEREESEDEVGNVQARNAVADCKSELGLILIKHGIFQKKRQ